MTFDTTDLTPTILFEPIDIYQKHPPFNNISSTETHKATAIYDILGAYLALTTVGPLPPPLINGPPSCPSWSLLPIALPNTRFIESKTDLWPAGSVVELYTEFGAMAPFCSDTYPPSATCGISDYSCVYDGVQHRAMCWQQGASCVHVM